MAICGPLVSVIIPAHDAADHLARSLQSALAQDLSTLEVIVVDDASSDATADVALTASRDDPRVVLCRSARNLGPAGARNLGLRAASGHWVALLDADDAFAPGRLGRLLAAAEASRADVVADNLLLCEAGPGLPPEPMLGPDLLGAPRLVDAPEFLLRNLPIPGRPRASYGFFKPVFRRAFLLEHGLRYDERLRFAEDFDLYLRVLLAGARMLLVPEPGYLYAIRRGSATDRHTAADLLRLRAVDRRLLRRPEVARDIRLAAALRRHLGSVERRLVWRLFTDALKAGQWRRGMRLAGSSRGRAGVIAGELIRAAPKLARRLLQPGWLMRQPQIS